MLFRSDQFGLLASNLNGETELILRHAPHEPSSFPTEKPQRLLASRMTIVRGRVGRSRRDRTFVAGGVIPPGRDSTTGYLGGKPPACGAIHAALLLMDQVHSHTKSASASMSQDDELFEGRLSPLESLRFAAILLFVRVLLPNPSPGVRRLPPAASPRREICHSSSPRL